MKHYVESLRNRELCWKLNQSQPSNPNIAETVRITPPYSVVGGNPAKVIKYLK